MPSWPCRPTVAPAGERHASGPAGSAGRIRVRTMSDKKKGDKQALKALRQERKTSIERARNAIKTQNKDIKAIRAAMKDGGRTVPEIAEATGMPTAQVLMYVATLKKYGEVAEGPKDGDYFKYELAAK